MPPLVPDANMYGYINADLKAGLTPSHGADATGFFSKGTSKEAEQMTALQTGTMRVSVRS